MAQRRHHYERAFEEFVRERRIPYVAVDEAKKALVGDASGTRLSRGDPGLRSLKSFDFVIYGGDTNLLLELKGRRVRAPKTRRVRFNEDGMLCVPAAKTRLDSWVTLEDIEALREWERLFGAGFMAAFAFVYWCDEQPPDSLFTEVFEHHGRWYAMRVALVEEYARVMKTRSTRWGTVHVPGPVFETISTSFGTPGWSAAGGGAART